RPFNTLLDALGDNRGDAVIASIAPNAETRRRADFSDPYYRTPARFAARDAYLKTMFTGAEVRSYPSAEAARDALRAKDVDLLFGDGISLAFWLNGSDS